LFKNNVFFLFGTETEKKKHPLFGFIRIKTIEQHVLWYIKERNYDSGFLGGQTMPSRDGNNYSFNFYGDFEIRFPVNIL